MIRHPGRKFVAFLVLAVAVTVGIGAQLVGAVPGQRYELAAAFDDVTGLRVGDRVRLAGVPVGQVRGIEVVGGRAQVTFDVDGEVRLPTDTAVVAGWADLLGNRQLDLHPGEAATLLEAGDTLAQTVSLADLGSVAASLGPIAQALDPQQLNELLAATADLLDRSGQDIAALVGDGRVLVETVGERADTIETLLADYALVADTLAQRDQQLRELVGNLVVLAEAFGGDEELLVGAIDDASEVVAALDDFLAANEGDLSELVGGIGEVVDIAHGRLDDLETGLVRLPDALEAVFSVVRHGDYIRVDATCYAPSEPPCPTIRRGGPVPALDDGGLRELLLGEARRAR